MKIRDGFQIFKREKKEQNHLYHESLNNVTPADVYFGRNKDIEDKRKEIKKEDFKAKKKTQFINYLTILNHENRLLILGLFVLNLLKTYNEESPKSGKI